MREIYVPSHRIAQASADSNRPDAHMERPSVASRSSSDGVEPARSRSGAVQPAAPLRRFFSSTARRSSDTAEPAPGGRSVEHSATPLGSAEQSAMRPHVKIVSIRDLQRWMAEEPFASCSNADAQRIRDAVAVLSHRSSRQQDVRDRTPRRLELYWTALDP